jgi:hypothetical protein
LRAQVGIQTVKRAGEHENRVLATLRHRAVRGAACG